MYTIQKKNLKEKYIRKKLYNNYLNDYNYFNKNNVKMGKIRKRNLDNQIINKKKQKENVPKMLYSNFYLGQSVPNLSIGNFYLKTHSLSNIKNNNINDNIYFNKTKYDKNYIEETIRLNSQDEKIISSHVNKPMMIFDDLFSCIDNLKIISHNEKEEEKKEEYNNNNIDNNNENKIIDNINNKNENIKNNIHLNLNERKDKILSHRIHKDNLSLSPPTIKNIFRNSNNKNNIKLKMSFTTNLSDDSIIKKILNERRNYKEILQFNDYGKYKFSRDGLNYPEKILENKLPNYKGDNKKEKIYFNYRKKFSNPDKIYNSIGSFNTKFNHELSRISHSYGKEESKGRFIKNPLIKRYENSIPYYDIYKDIKFIENRYLDKGKYKYKLLPLINAKIRNFDRLGQKIYKMNIQKRNLQLKIDSLGLSKTNYEF